MNVQAFIPQTTLNNVQIADLVSRFLKEKNLQQDVMLSTEWISLAHAHADAQRSIVILPYLAG